MWGFCLTEKICYAWKKLLVDHSLSINNINSDFRIYSWHTTIRYFSCWNVFLWKKEKLYSLIWIFFLAKQLYTIILRWSPRKPFLNLFKLAWNTTMIMWELNLGFYSQVFFKILMYFCFKVISLYFLVLQLFLVLHLLHCCPWGSTFLVLKVLWAECLQYCKVWLQALQL